MTIRIAASASRSARNGHSSVLRSGHRIAVEIVVPPARAIELRRSSRSGPHRNKTSAGARIAASDPGVMSGVSARLRSRRPSPSRFSLRPRHSVRSLGARRLQADLKVRHGSNVRSRRLVKQSRRDGPMLVVVRPRVAQKESRSSSAKSRRNGTSVGMTMDGAVAVLIRRGPSSPINLASVAALDLIAEDPAVSAMGGRMIAHRKGRPVSVGATDRGKVVGSGRRAAGPSASTRSRRAASSASKVAAA